MRWAMGSGQDTKYRERMVGKESGWEARACPTLRQACREAWHRRQGGTFDAHPPASRPATMPPGGGGLEVGGGGRGEGLLELGLAAFTAGLLAACMPAATMAWSIALRGGSPAMLLALAAPLRWVRVHVDR